LEALSFTGYEARILVALLRLGSATIRQLSEATGIGRTNLYPVLDSLQTRRLAQRLPGRYSLWACPAPAEVLAVLEEEEEARAAAAQEAFRHAEEARTAVARESFRRRLEEAKADLDQLPLGAEQTAAVITVNDDARVGAAYLEAVASVEGEILVFNKGPYPGDMTEPAPEVLDCLARGVRARAMWQSFELDDPGIRSVVEGFAEAGVDQRLVDALPVGMAVLGDKLVLLRLPPDEDTQASVDFHTASVRNRAMSHFASAAFDHFWSQGIPYQPSHAHYERSTSS